MSSEPKRGRPRKVLPIDPPVASISPEARAFALSVWNNQSPDEPRKWRLERVALAMANRGYSMEGIEL